MATLQPFVPLEAILARCLIDSPWSGCGLVAELNKTCSMRCFSPADAEKGVFLHFFFRYSLKWVREVGSWRSVTKACYMLCFLDVAGEKLIFTVFLQCSF